MGFLLAYFTAMSDALGDFRFIVAIALLPVWLTVIGLFLNQVFLVLGSRLEGLVHVPVISPAQASFSANPYLLQVAVVLGLYDGVFYYLDFFQVDIGRC